MSYRAAEPTRRKHFAAWITIGLILASILLSSRFAFGAGKSFHLTAEQIYQSLLSIRYPAPIFDVSAGLLLRDDIHHTFDRLELSFYLLVRS